MIKPSDEIFSPFKIGREFSYQGPFSAAIPTAEHYGFRLVKPIVTNKASQKDDECPILINQHIKLNAVDSYLNNLDDHCYPALLCHTHRSKEKKGFVNLDTYGVEDPFVETLLLKCAYEILVEEGHKNLVIEINSFGSAESYQKFAKEVAKFTKKHAPKFSTNDQEALSHNPFYIYKIDESGDGHLTQNQQELLLHRPRPIACLSENCRGHLKELLEHLEEAGLPYHLNPYLFPQSGKHTETVYKIVDTDTDEVVAYGERFNSQANKHLQDKLEQLPTETVSCAAITITLPAGKAEKYQKTDPLDEQRQYKVYFAHSGLIAKKNTLRVLSLFRDAGIDVKHSAIKNTLREQLYHGEQFKFPVTTILGVKEVQDNTIIVRNNQANRQKAVPLSRMCAYVKRQLR